MREKIKQLKRNMENEERRLETELKHLKNIEYTAKNANDLSGLVYDLRKNILNMSRNEFAACAGVGRTTVYNIEHGFSCRFSTVLKILKCLNIKLYIIPPITRKAK